MPDQMFWVVLRSQPDRPLEPALINAASDGWCGTAYFLGDECGEPLDHYEVLGPVVIPTREEILAASKVAADAA